MLFENAINSKKQGDIGMCYAMAYYAKLEWTVSIPVTDSQDYDLVVDNGTTQLALELQAATVVVLGNVRTLVRTRQIYYLL